MCLNLGQILMSLKDKGKERGLEILYLGEFKVG